MKFIIEPINDTDCRIVDIDCSAMQGQSVDELTIPATVEQDGKVYAVKEVGRGVCSTNKFDENTAKFATLRRLKKIIFSEGIEVIDGVMTNSGNNADERGNAETLTDVVLPSTLKKIGDNSFYCCKTLSSINIPDSVEEIGEDAFANCESLKMFPWPASLRKVNVSAFSGMMQTSDENGNNRISLRIPDSMEEISGGIGWGYPYINECTVSAKAWNALDASSLTSRIYIIDIPEGVTKIIGKYSHVERVTLPSTIEEIGPEAFKDSHALDCITELPAVLKSIGTDAFYNARKSDETKELRIPSSVELVGEGAFANCNLRLVGDKATMKSMMGQPGAFNGTAVVSIDIPEGATEVVVSNCPELVSLTIPSTVSKITRISSCPKLKELYIPDSVTVIDCIDYCDSLESLRLSQNLEQLKYIGNCDSLKELYLPDSLKKLKDPESYGEVFHSLRAKIKASLEVWKLICSCENCFEKYAPLDGELIIEEGIETITDGFLYGGYNGSDVTAVSLPSTLSRIGQSAFKKCGNLKSLTIPAGVEVVPVEMASECYSLESVEFAEGSQLKEVGSEAFIKTKLKEFTFPDGFTKLGGEVFKDIETLESVTFPASTTDFGFKVDSWGDVTTPFVRCKNLKQVIFLADDPATAAYPVALGKLCDWYVPDHMVDHVKAFIDKAKAEYPKVKGIGAKSVKPLSKLKGGAPEPKKKAPAKKQQAMTQAISMHTLGLRAVYRFAVAEEDMPMLDNNIDMAILAARYLRDKSSECSFEICRGSLDDELSLDTAVNSATEKQWHATPKSKVKLDFAYVASLPENFPVALAPELAQHGGFENLFASRCPNYGKELPEGAPAYLVVGIKVSAHFDFMIGEKEKFNVKKITVMDGWFSYRTKRCWRFGMMYNGRYIPATSFAFSTGQYALTVKAYKEPSEETEISAPELVVDGVKFEYPSFNTQSYPFVNDILSLVK